MENTLDTFPLSQNMLVKIMQDTYQVVEQRKKVVPLSGIQALAAMQRRTYDLSFTIRYDEKVSLIAQIKRTAPDMQHTIEDIRPLALATDFVRAGASALMIATNERYYSGSIVDVVHVAQALPIPVIRQDFIYDEYQIVEARAAGADAVLLIAALYDAEHLCNLISITQRNRMNAVVQVQNEREIKTAIDFEPRVIAISNRDMETFTVDIDRTLHLRDLIPPHMAVISMGGLRTAEEVARVHSAGVDGIIIGQALLSAPNTAAAIRELFKLTDDKPHDQTLSNPQ